MIPLPPPLSQCNPHLNPLARVQLLSQKVLEWELHFPRTTTDTEKCLSNCCYALHLHRHSVDNGFTASTYCEPMVLLLLHFFTLLSIYWGINYWHVQIQLFCTAEDIRGIYNPISYDIHNITHNFPLICHRSSLRVTLILSPWVYITSESSSFFLLLIRTSWMDAEEVAYEKIIPSVQLCRIIALVTTLLTLTTTEEHTYPALSSCSLSEFKREIEESNQCSTSLPYTLCVPLFRTTLWFIAIKLLLICQKNSVLLR